MQDHPAEDEVVEEEVDNADRDNVHPACLCLALKYTEDEEVEESAREGETHGDVQHVRDHICRAREYDLHGEEGRSNEEERELDRLRDAREHTGECCREEQSARDLFLFGACAMVHRESRTRQAEDHEDELTGEVARGICTEMCDIRRGELREEDVLTALDELSVDHHGAADARLPEWQVEDVMQPEGDERALDDTEDQRADIARARDKAAEGEDALLCKRPDKVHGDPDEEEDDGRDDGNETRTAEEGECIRQNNLMVSIV